ncbi:MAG: DNA-binding protein [Nostoc sp.]|uniref:DNA-binding protein n=1 Tax=Nostoc sp. TaxID=1180 RepID=UPI002FF4F4EE
MEENLYVNDLIEWELDSGNKVLERILWIDEDYTIAFLIDVNTNKGLPKLKKVSEIVEEISNRLAFKQRVDPWARVIREEDLRDTEKVIRDKAWNIISELVLEEPLIYERKARGSLVQDAIGKYNAREDNNKLIPKTVYGYLRKFWQRGKTKNSLIPDYINCGGRGKTKAYSEVKRGKPRTYKHINEIGEGINITEEDKRCILIGIDRYYKNKKNISLNQAYKLTLKDFYTYEDYIENGKLKFNLIPRSQQPTYTQFKYWYNIEFEQDVKTSIISRKGSKAYALKHRPILGTSKSETPGPGSRYQIDATVVDVFLRSVYNINWIIGRPIIYVVIDVFSQMIVGVYVGLEGPSWIGAMMALTNVVTDKVKFCKEYGIEISEDQWPCKELGDCILGDRGELIGMPPEDTLSPNLYIRIENAASKRGDWKGLVESRFHILHHETKPFIPGFVDQELKQMTGIDYRLRSRLNIDSFTGIVINLIISHNNRRHNRYQRDTDMIADDVLPIPTELWKWGIVNRSGRLKSYDEDVVKLNLLPIIKATITSQGIKLNGKLNNLFKLKGNYLYYTCEKAEKEQWFTKARSGLLTQEEKSIAVSYDIRKPNFIYLPSRDGRSFEKCSLIDPEEIYSNKSFYDIDYKLTKEDVEKQETQGEELQKEIDVTVDIENIVNTAEDNFKLDQDNTITKTQQIAKIGENRKNEKNQRREDEGFELQRTQSESISDSKDEVQTKDTSSNKLLVPDYSNILEQNREGRKRGRSN